MTRLQRPATWAWPGLIALAAWFGYLAVLQVDDAFIIYRYAENLAAGDGLVYNQGERVEGVTCLSWTLLLVPWVWAGVPLPLITPALSALAGIAALLIVPGISARLGGRDRPDGVDWLVAALAGFHPSFAYWSVGALETVPYTLCLVLGVRDQLRELQSGRGMRSALWFGLAAITRPEAPLLIAALALVRLTAGEAGAWATRLRRLIAWGGGIGLIFLPALMFRWFYFGDLFPNTYYAKTGAPLIDRIQAGWLYTQRFFTSVVPSFGSETVPGAVAGGLLLAGLVVWALWQRRLRTPAAVVAALGTAVVLEGGDWMSLHRFWVPGLPFIFLLFGAALRRWFGERRIWIAAIASVWIASGIALGVVVRDGGNGLEVNARGYRDAHRKIADTLKAEGREGDSVAVMDIGLIGYYGGLRVIDISGLTEPRVARAPGGFLDKVYPPEWILDQEPRFVVLVEPGYRIDARIAAHPRFAAEYQRRTSYNQRRYWRPAGDYELTLYERRAAEGSE
ncbi:hypothetical protein ABI59_03520 [Acidobacteria bacterium Mor1]|nr:hypothetical protein ABI59_03520 [Acidobacteria bacterium Mor1]